ncbi:MAG: PepSY-like domain-containing protein [Bacteroidales bacterium]
MKRGTIRTIVYTSIFCVSSLFFASAKDINYSQLPAPIQNSVKGYINPNRIMKVIDNPENYRIEYGKNNYIEYFKSKPVWKKVFIPNGIPPKLFNTLPKPVLDYVRKNYPKSKFIAMELLDGQSIYQLKMIDKVELMLDPQGQLITLEN